MCMCVVLVYFSILLDKGTKVLYTHDNYWLVILVFYFLAFGSIMRISGRNLLRRNLSARHHITMGLQNFSKESPVGVNLEKKKTHISCCIILATQRFLQKFSNKRLGNPHLQPTRESTFSRELATENNSGNFPVLFRYHIFTKNGDTVFEYASTGVIIQYTTRLYKRASSLPVMMNGHSLRILLSIR
ncbi:AVN_collapsed_G0034410.mRNA.1.CDS.1 [Saccharomyces cerevisiae]|nr:AVN_collapsed_G0034410.mRNA.1.CDS.1 [Saccharomyces cerevisiae]